MPRCLSLLSYAPHTARRESKLDLNAFRRPKVYAKTLFSQEASAAKTVRGLCSYLLLLREMPMRLAALAFSAVGGGSADVIVWFTLGAWPAPP